MFPAFGCPCQSNPFFDNPRQFGNYLPSEKHLGNYLHVRNFLDCVTSRKNPVEADHRTASLCHLGNIAMKLGQKIRWDPKREQVVDDPEAAEMLDRPMRPPWTI